MKILIVEDDIFLGDILQNYLQQLGHEEVRVCPRGLEAEALLEKRTFDCAFVDLKLPDIDGLSLLERIKGRDRTLPVIMMSGFPTMESTIQAMRKGASDFLTKPFTLQDLALSLERVTKERILLLENLGLKLECQAQRQLQAVNVELQEKVREKERLFEISRRIDEVRSSEDLYATIIQLAHLVTQADRVGFFVYLPEQDRIALISEKGFCEAGLTRPVFRVDASRLKERVGSGSRLALVRPGDFLRGWTGLDDEPGAGARGSGASLAIPGGGSERGMLQASYGCWPLWIRGELFGFLMLSQNSENGSLSASETGLLDFLMRKAALAVENMALYECLISNFYGILKSLVNALEAKDPYTGKHSERVTIFAVRLARTMGCRPNDIEVLRTVGYLHDIGKIGITDKILNKPGGLVPEEYEMVKRHPVIGEAIVRELGLSAEERAIIRHHHERWDGKGYPDGLSGTDIPFLARIVTVADAFDAMTSKRAYRDSLPLEQAKQEIRDNRGRQFDPDVVDAFFAVMEERKGSDGDE
jgi:putative nucleotidyltransferase with HDIG domain